jgi:putative addiction module component (TIGR02574 family)
MDVETLEVEALKLDTQSRARLAERLLASLDELSEEEAAQIWAAEAQRRDAEMDVDPGQHRPSEDVFRDAYSRLK